MFMTTPVNAQDDAFLAVDVANVNIGIVGGTGDQGRGLARRFALAGHNVIVGSRDVARATDVASALPATVSGASNNDCVQQSDVVIVAVPWDGHAKTLQDLADSLRGKIVVDCVNPLGFDKQGAFALDVVEGSAAQQAATLLPESTVVAAFHHISAVTLLDESIDSIETDVMVLGDNRSATDLIQSLVDRIPGMRGVYAGRLRNARQVEALTANLISVNRRYKAHAGIRITDI